MTKLKKLDSYMYYIYVLQVQFCKKLKIVDLVRNFPLDFNKKISEITFEIPPTTSFYFHPFLNPPKDCSRNRGGLMYLYATLAQQIFAK